MLPFEQIVFHFIFTPKDESDMIVTEISRIKIDQAVKLGED